MTNWLLRHRLLGLGLVIALPGIGGYFGLDRSRGGGGQPFPSGWPGALIGSVSTAAIALVLLAARRVRRGST